ncbi:MAG TPA: asparagine synthase (glutamine-hydrolyzing) [Gammaproteobacteria bacterium]
MCGIAGCLTASGRVGDLEASAVAMAAALAHRGPDDAGVWVDRGAGVALAHRRLAIIDLSPAGHQPMRGARGRYVIVLNGEIYNHLELRAELEAAGSAPAWRGRSDTESLLAAIEAWGVRTAVEKSVGMFAFALWDREERTLTLARDRLGEKPLYYGLFDGSLVFASELKALCAWPGIVPDVDRGAVALLFRHGYIPAPYSIYRGVRKLLPGAMLTLGTRDLAGGRLPEPERYWSAKAVAEAGAASPFDGDDAEAVDELERLLAASVRGQMIADVPLGAFLSGGIDSSTVVALMQAQSSRPVRTFTIGFEESGYDEARYAKAVAGRLGTDHTELYVTPREALDVIPRLPVLYDEPFSDPSQVPTFLVAQLARRSVTVALSGDGGDELFGGYDRYARAAAWERRRRLVPSAVRRLVAARLEAAEAGGRRAGEEARATSDLGKAWTGLAESGERLRKLAHVVGARHAETLYAPFACHSQVAERAVLGAAASPTAYTDPALWLERGDSLRRMTYLDLVVYLPDDVLVKVDRAAMAVSLETRVPLLDHRLVEFALRLPSSMKVRNGAGKWLLRQLLIRYVPAELVDRPKMGFGVPIGEWLRGPLRDWAEALLDATRLAREGFLDVACVRRRWTAHLDGRADWQYFLWDVLMFQAWLDRWKSVRSEGDHVTVDAARLERVHACT